MEPDFYEASCQRANAYSAFLNTNDSVKKTYHQLHPGFGISQMLFWMKTEPLHLPHFPQQMHFHHPTHTPKIQIITFIVLPTFISPIYLQLSFGFPVFAQPVEQVG